MKLYHVTLASNLPSILERGLIPAVGPRSAAFGEEKPAVYFFRSLDDVEDALVNWLGEEFDEDERIIVIEARLPDDASIEEEAFETRVRSIVPPCVLRVMDDFELPFATDCETEEKDSFLTL